MSSIIGSSGNRYKILKELGRGGQGIVFLCQRETDGSKLAVKWYFKRTASITQRDRIDDLVRRGPPQCDERGVKFIWPLETVTHSEKNSFGYAMSLIDGSNYYNYNKIIRRKAPMPTLKSLCKISFNVAHALDKIHAAGLAYCDINLGNIQVNPMNGHVVVCDNDNVLPNGSEPEILGMIDFQAPEISKGTSRPDVLSDLYSLAILLYQIWMWEHPLEGALTAKVRSWDEVAKRRYFVDEPLFCHHPSDKRNSAEGDPILGTSVARWYSLCSPGLRDLFIKSFTKGIDIPNRRPSSDQWKHAFMEVYQNVFPCRACGREVLFGSSELGLTCPECSAPAVANTVLSVSNGVGSCTVVAREGAELLRANVEVGSEDGGLSDVIGCLEKHPKGKGLILRNTEERVWYYRVGADSFEIQPGQARPLVSGGIVHVGGATISVETSDG